MPWAKPIIIEERHSTKLVQFGLISDHLQKLVLEGQEQQNCLFGRVRKGTLALQTVQRKLRILVEVRRKRYKRRQHY